jgi:hypothetical protein
MNPDRDPDAAIWENFRTITLDPSTQQTVTLDSGTYRQVPSRHATYRDTLSLYWNELYRPGYARRLLDPLGDARFGTASGAELEQKREIARKAREMIKQEKENKIRAIHGQPIAAGNNQAPTVGAHLQDTRNRDPRNRDPRYGVQQYDPVAAQSGTQGHLTAGLGRYQPRPEQSYPTRDSQYGARRGRGYHGGGRSRSGFDSRPNQPAAWAPMQEPAHPNGTENNSQNMRKVQGHTFGGVMHVHPHQTRNMIQHGAAPGQEARYPVPVPVVQHNNQLSGHNRVVPIMAEGMRHMTQTNPPVPAYGGAVHQDLSLNRQSGQQQRNQRQYGDAPLGQNATRSYPTARQVGLGIRYDEQNALASAGAQISAGVGNVHRQNIYNQAASQSFLATQQFDARGNTQNKVISRPYPATRPVDSPITRHDQVTRRSIHPAQTASSLNTPRFSEISQDTTSRESLATSATTQTNNLASTVPQGHTARFAQKTPLIAQTSQAAPAGIQGFAGRNLSAISEAPQPHILAPKPIRAVTHPQLHEHQQYVELDREYEQWLDEENEISERYDGPPVDEDRVPIKRYEKMDPVVAGAIRRMEEVDVHHEYQSLLTRRAAANNLTIVPPPFVPRASSFRAAAQQISSPQVAASPQISANQASRAAQASQTSRAASPQVMTTHAPTPRHIIPQIAALQASSPQLAALQGSLSPTAADFSLDSSDQYVGYTIFGQQPGQASRDPSPVRPPRRGGRRLYESRSSMPTLLRNISYESHRSAPGPQSFKFNRHDLNKGGPTS